MVRSPFLVCLILATACAASPAPGAAVLRAQAETFPQASRLETPTHADSGPREGSPSPQKATDAAERDREQFALQARSDREQRAYQIAELRKTLELYRQFLERAGNDPQY